MKEKEIDQETGIWTRECWGYECGRGFVSSSRFMQPGEQVIPKTNREKTRKWLKLNQPPDDRQGELK